MSPSLVLSGVEKYGDRTTKKQESHPALKAGQFAFGKVELRYASSGAVDRIILAIGALLSFSAKARMHHQPERPIFPRNAIIHDSTLPPIPRQIASQGFDGDGPINVAILAR
jgi:hypothetical protein